MESGWPRVDGQYYWASLVKPGQWQEWFWWYGVWYIHATAVEDGLWVCTWVADLSPFAYFYEPDPEP